MNKIKLRLVNTNVMILVFILCGLRVYTSIHPIFELRIQATKSNEVLKAKNDALNVNKEKLKLLKKEYYRQSQIREQYHLSKKDEILFVFPKEDK